MAQDTTKLIIDIESRLRNLERTLKGLDRVRKSLQAVADVKVGQQTSQTSNRAALAAQKLVQQQQKLNIQAQELANRQERARQTTERLTLAQQRLTIASANTAKQIGQQADTHVRAFRAIQRGIDSADAHVRAFKANETALAKAPQLDTHVKAFRSIQRGVQDANAHVRVFREQQAALAKAPQLDAHVKAFRAIQQGAEDANRHVQFFRAQQAALARAPQLDAHVKAFRALESAAGSATQRLSSIGNALRGLGQGLASLGATLTVAVTAPIAAAGAASVDAAVRLDSLKRGLAAIVGSADEANRQLGRLTQLAKLPGIGFEEAIQGSIRLQAVGFSAREAEVALRQFSNAIALTGGGRDELARVTVQLGQLAAKGKVLSQDLRPIIEAAPAVGRALLQAFGTVNSDDIQALGLSTREFLNILVSQLGELPRAAAGAKNSFENFRDEVFRAAAAVGGALLPSLIRLVEVVGPVITKLADAFAKLPQPVQLVAIGAAGLLAAFGPLAFVVGQLTLGVGRLLVGFVELNAAGILPTIVSLRALAAGSLSAAAAQRTLAASSALVFGVLGGIATILAAGVAAYAIYNAFQKDAVTLSKERAEQLTAEIDALEQQAKFLGGLGKGVARTADEQQRLTDIYDKLNTTAQIRIAGITDEEKRLIVLRAELEKLIKLRGQERIQQAASVAAQIAASAATITANEKSRASIAARIAANNALVETLEREGRITTQTRQELERLGQSASVDVATAIQNLQNQSARLVARQKELGDNTEETGKELEGYLEALRALDPHQRLSAQQLLTLAKNMGLFKGDVNAMVPVLERYIQKTREATKATDDFSRSLDEQEKALRKSGEEADAEQKRRRASIQAATALAREASDSFEGARKNLLAFIAANPRLRADIQREAQISGKTFDEFVQESLENAFGRGKGGDKAGTGLRNAQEQLAKALADVALASSEREVAIQQAKNEQLLQQAESAHRLQIISYREFLETRAALTAASIDKEIEQQTAVVVAAKNAQARLLGEAGKAGIPVTERTRRLAQAAEANETAIKAETKLADLQSRRQLITDALQQSLKEASQQQLKDIRQLEVEYGELTGRIEDALNAATDEKFRESLRDLALAQDHLNKQIERATELKDADKVAELEAARAQNQRQIEAIQNIITQERATNRLAAANEFVRRAQEEQAELERELAFQVEFRGLAEEDAIAQRLAGERKLADALRLSRDIVQSTIDALSARGVKPPQALLDFIRDTNDAVRGLGELPFSEQFRLAQKEFDRINDERIAKIQDVERAVRNRDIAEVEGAILVRRVNNQYTADLEAQLALLKQIAERSRDRGLQQQAADAAETVKDTRDEVAGLSEQIDAAGKDAFRSGLTDFFNDILNRTATAKEALLNLLNSVTTAINNVIAENLSKELFESIFGGADKQTGGLIASIKRIFGFGGDGAGKAAGTVEAVAGKATDTTTAVALQTAATTSAAALTTGGTTAAAALTTGGTAAATALTTGGATAATTIATSVTAAATAFASSVIAAGAAFAAAVAAGAGAQAIGGLGGALGGAETGIYPAVPGGLYKFVEGGYPEAVLTTDPRHAMRQVSILREFLQKTRGLGGRIPEFAAGGLVSRETAEANLLSSIHRAAPTSMRLGDVTTATAGGNGDMTFRQILVDDQRDISNWYHSAEGDRVQVQWLQRNRPRVQKLLGIRGN